MRGTSWTGVSSALLGCALLATTALAACSSHREDPGSAVPNLDPLGPAVTVPSGTPSTPVTDQTVLRNALLTVADLPAGFTPAPDPETDLGLPPASHTADTDQSSTDPAECAAVLSPLAEQGPRAVSSASASFIGPAFASLDQDAASYATSDGASLTFTEVQNTLEHCTEYSGTDADGIAVHYRIGGREQPSAGDASIAFRIVTTSEGLSLTSDVVVAVVGSTVTQVVATGQDPIDAGVLDQLTRTAVGKLTSAPVG